MDQDRYCWSEGRVYTKIDTSDTPSLRIPQDNMWYNCGEDRMGMRVTSGSVTLEKDPQNLIGISIGGGAPYCPCLYVVQIFDNTPASRDGTLASGDEITGINGDSMKGRTKVEVARMIQSHKRTVTIFYNKLHADPKQGKSLDIVLKKVKHRVVEHMSSSTADTLGLSRAILVNDSLVKKLEELTSTGGLFLHLMSYTRNVLKATYELATVHRAFGEVFGDVGVKEPQPRASEAFTAFAQSHRTMERSAIATLKRLKPIVTDLGTFVNKVVPDARQTIKKYLDAKFEYLSYCLKVKELDDEEYSYIALHEPLYRVETGNYEYRLVLRCRQDARTKFAKLRNDVLVKLELLDNKHVQDIVQQLQRFVQTMSQYASESYDALKDVQVFPIELDLNHSTFSCKTASLDDQEDEEDDDVIPIGDELCEDKAPSTEYTWDGDTNPLPVSPDSELLVDHQVEENAESTGTARCRSRAPDSSPIKPGRSPESLRRLTDRRD